MLGTGLLLQEQKFYLALEIIPISIAGNSSGLGSLWGAEIPSLSRKQWDLEVSRDWRIPML